MPDYGLPSGARAKEQLAPLAGVDRKLVYRTELGQTSPRMDVLALLAEALDVDLGDMVGPGLAGDG